MARYLNKLVLGGVGCPSHRSSSHRQSEEESHTAEREHRMINRNTSVLRGRRFTLGSFALFVLAVLVSMATSAQSWPRCISGCTANDVELIEVTADVLGSCTPGGTVEANLWVSLYFNRNKSYCVRFVADIYIDGELAIADMVSDPLNVFSNGAYPNIYFGTVSLPCGSSLSLENIKIM